ncbi:hypothetical protein [uncultured Brachyspira sp.]|uniref:hypothetical protein n=1 Tax=uncultured Brachyspira sp. TaxID=221953 RepID=UPI00258CD488|nr:hypothetical protein [uncultured Brachyspira sp.]
MSDGQPDSPPNQSSQMTYDMASKKKLSCFQLGIGDQADMQTLAKFSPRKPLRLKGLNFEGFLNGFLKAYRRYLNLPLEMK